MRATKGGVSYRDAYMMSPYERKALVAQSQWIFADHEGKTAIFESLLLNGQMDDEGVELLHKMLMESAPRNSK